MQNQEMLFTITVIEDGYKEYTFTYQAPVTDSDYTYVYAGLSWSEYWASEGVLAAGSTESSEELDSRGETDKGAFDVVTRATTNHGLHRGSFQCTDVIETKRWKYFIAWHTGKIKILL